MNTHRSLPAWQEARQLVGVAYRVADSLPPAEKFIAIPQLLRAAWSIHNNIAEGNAKLGKGELRKYFDSALGSLAEVDAMIATLGDRYPLDPECVDEAERHRRAITGMIFGMLRTRRQ